MKVGFGLICAFAVAALSPAASASAQSDTSQATEAKYSTATTDIGTLVDNPQTKAILDKHVPGFADNPQLGMARAMTMRQIQTFASDMLTDVALDKIDAKLAKLST